MPMPMSGLQTYTSGKWSAHGQCDHVEASKMSAWNFYFCTCIQLAFHLWGSQVQLCVAVQEMEEVGLDVQNSVENYTMSDI